MRAEDRDMKYDLRLLAIAFFKELFVSDCEYGAIGVDPKRPFGNRNVEGDILEIIGWEMEGNDGEDECYASWQNKYAGKLYREELIPYLQERCLALLGDK